MMQKKKTVQANNLAQCFLNFFGFVHPFREGLPIIHLFREILKFLQVFLNLQCD